MIPAQLFANLHKLRRPRFAREGERRNFGNGRGTEELRQPQCRGNQASQPAARFLKWLKKYIYIYISIYTGNTRMYCAWNNHIYAISYKVGSERNSTLIPWHASDNSLPFPECNSSMATNRYMLHFSAFLLNLSFTHRSVIKLTFQSRFDLQIEGISDMQKEL
jgi:hypothetical protein